MSSFEEPLYFSDVFNSALFDFDVSNTLTIHDADRRYLAISGGTMIGQTVFNNQITVNAASIFVGNVSMSASFTTTNTITANNTNDSIQITNISSSGRSNIKFTNDTADFLESGVRGSTAANPRTHYWYSNGSYKLLMDLPTGDIKILSTTISSSTATGSLTISGGVGIAKQLYIGGQTRITDTTMSANTTSGALTISGGLGVSGAINGGGNIAMTGVLNSLGTGTNSFSGNIQGNASYTSVLDRFLGIILQDGFATSTSITSDGARNALRLQSASSAGVYGICSLSPNGLFINRSNYNPIGSCNTNCLIDFGIEAHPMSINLYGGTYGIGAFNNQLQFMSGGSAGHAWYVGASYDISTYLADLSTAGSYTCNGKLRCKGTSSAGFTGSGLELGYNGTYGEIYGYNRSSLLYRPVYIGNEIYCTGGNQTSIGRGANATTWTLHVGSSTQSITSYAYLNSGGGVGTSGSSGSVAYSAYFDARVVCNGELDVLSDQRVKSDIRDITEEEASNFINRCRPKHYIFKPDSNNEPQFGYLAQSICKAGGLDTLIVCRNEPGLPEEIDEDGFVSPKDTVFTVSYQKIPSLIHKYILMQDERIMRLEEQLELLLSRPVVRNWIDKQKNKD